MVRFPDVHSGFLLVSSGPLFMRTQHHEEADNMNSNWIAIGLLDFGFVFSTVLMTAGNVSLPFRWSD